MDRTLQNAIKQAREAALWHASQSMSSHHGSAIIHNNEIIAVCCNSPLYHAETAVMGLTGIANQECLKQGWNMGQLTTARMEVF